MFTIDRLASSDNKTVAAAAHTGFDQRIGILWRLVGVALPAVALAGSIGLVASPVIGGAPLCEDPPALGRVPERPAPAAIPRAIGLVADLLISPAAIARNPTPDDAPDAVAKKRSDAARTVAEKILGGITKNDASLVVPLCATPFLGGAPNNQRIAKDAADLGRALNEDLCRGPYGPFMFEPRWEIKAILTPAEFRVEFGDYLAQRQDLHKRLEELGLRRSDRIVVENVRGMLIIVREDGDASRSIGIVPMGFGPPPFKATRDVIFGRRHGMALTLAVAQPPKDANGSAIVFLSADSFIAFPKQLDGRSLTPRLQGLLDAGFTLFFVTPGSAPKSTIPEILGDIHTAVRYIRYNADRFQVDPDRIGMIGASACGYLAVMLAVADGNGPTFPPNSDPSRVFVQFDPVDAISSRVQAVISFCPPTDWVNYDENGASVLETALFQPYRGLLDLYDYDLSRNGYTKVASRERHLEELKKLSPVYLATAKAAPILLIHGDKDNRVPVKHSLRMFDALKKAGAKAEIIVKTGSPHDWPETPEETAMIIKWLNDNLSTKN